MDIIKTIDKVLEQLTEPESITSLRLDAEHIMLYDHDSILDKRIASLNKMRDIVHQHGWVYYRAHLEKFRQKYEKNIPRCVFVQDIDTIDCGGGFGSYQEYVKDWKKDFVRYRHDDLFPSIRPVPGRIIPIIREMSRCEYGTSSFVTILKQIMNLVTKFKVTRDAKIRGDIAKYQVESKNFIKKEVIDSFVSQLLTDTKVDYSAINERINRGCEVLKSAESLLADMDVTKIDIGDVCLGSMLSMPVYTDQNDWIYKYDKKSNSYILTRDEYERPTLRSR